MITQQEQLKPDENEKRNLLKREKPYVYEKIMKFDEKEIGRASCRERV